MSDNDSKTERPTRRDTLKYGGALVTGSVLAGCSALVGRDDDHQQSESGGSYEACIEPAGCLTLEEPPETYAVYNGGWADMAFALGQREGFITAGNMIPEFLFEPFDLDVPTREDLPAMWAEDNWDKESFYEIGPDVFLIDPEYLHGVGWDSNWAEEDTDEIIDNVAPFFGNNMRRRREFHDHELYTLYEGFERLAALFQEQERYEAFAEVHDELQSEIQSRLPPESERPQVGLINGGSDPTAGQFYPLYARSEGYEMKPYRDLDVQSAFSRNLEDGGQIGYERLVEIDPDIILVHWGIGTTGDTDQFSASAFREQYVTPMEEDAVGSQLTAVQEGAVYPGQYGEQGPIVNLLQTEMTAQQLYPEAFGAFDPESFPEVPEANRLFDRKEVAEIIAGDR